MRTLLFVVLSAALATASPTVAQTPFGPLTSESEGPLQRVGFIHAVEGADLLTPGIVQAESWMGYSNIFSVDSTAAHQLAIDLERLSSELAVRWGATTRFEAGGRVAFETTGGGILDPVISGFHRALHLPNGNRTTRPSGGYAQRLTEASGQLRLDVPKRTMALQDVGLFAKWRAWQSPDGRRLVSLSGAAQFPTRDNLIGSQRADVSLMALMRGSWTRWHVHAATGGATVRASNDFDGLLRPVVFFADFAAERSLGPSKSAVFQLSAETPRLKGFDDRQIDGWPVVMVFGLTGQVRENWRMEVSLEEDLLANTIAADFTLGVGIRRRF